jgi:hypothetical protein
MRKVELKEFVMQKLKKKREILVPLSKKLQIKC